MYLCNLCDLYFSPLWYVFYQACDSVLPTKDVKYTFYQGCEVPILCPLYQGCEVHFLSTKDVKYTKQGNMQLYFNSTLFHTGGKKMLRDHTKMSQTEDASTVIYSGWWTPKYTHTYTHSSSSSGNITNTTLCSLQCQWRKYLSMHHIDSPGVR